MQLQKNTWHEGLLEEAKVKDLVDKLPEMLKNFTDRFLGCFQRSEQTFNTNVYLNGLLSNLKRKPVEPIALEYMDHYEFSSWIAWHRHMPLVFIANAFLLEIRLLVTDKKSPILTLPMALLLVVATLSGDGKIIKTALKKLNYYLRHNYCAYKSHSLKNLKSALLDKNEFSPQQAAGYPLREKIHFRCKQRGIQSSEINLRSSVVKCKRWI